MSSKNSHRHNEKDHKFITFYSNLMIFMSDVMVLETKNILIEVLISVSSWFFVKSKLWHSPVHYHLTLSVSSPVNVVGLWTGSCHCCFNNTLVCIPWWHKDITSPFSKSYADQSNHAYLFFLSREKSPHFCMIILLFVETHTRVHVFVLCSCV